MQQITWNLKQYIWNKRNIQQITWNLKQYIRNKRSKQQITWNPKQQNLPCCCFSNEDGLCRSKERRKIETNAEACKMETKMKTVYATDYF